MAKVMGTKVFVSMQGRVCLEASRYVKGDLCLTGPTLLGGG